MCLLHFQKGEATSKPANSGLFTHLGKTGNASSSSGSKQNAGVSKQRSDKNSYPGSDIVTSKDKSVRNVGNIDLTKDIVAHQTPPKEPIVIPETQIFCSPADVHFPTSNNGTNQEMLIPDTPEEEQSKQKKNFSRSFLTGATNFAQRPGQAAKALRDQEKLQREKMTKARKSLISMSVKFNQNKEATGKSIIKSTDCELEKLDSRSNENPCKIQGQVVDEIKDDDIVMDTPNVTMMKSKLSRIEVGTKETVDKTQLDLVSKNDTTPVKLYAGSGNGMYLKRMTKDEDIPSAKRANMFGDNEESAESNSSESDCEFSLLEQNFEKHKGDLKISAYGDEISSEFPHDISNDQKVKEITSPTVKLDKNNSKKLGKENILSNKPKSCFDQIYKKKIPQHDTKSNENYSDKPHSQLSASNNNKFKPKKKSLPSANSFSYQMSGSTRKKKTKSTELVSTDGDDLLGELLQELSPNHGKTNKTNQDLTSTPVMTSLKSRGQKSKLTKPNSIECHVGDISKVTKVTSEEQELFDLLDNNATSPTFNKTKKDQSTVEEIKITRPIKLKKHKSSAVIKMKNSPPAKEIFKVSDECASAFDEPMDCDINTGSVCPGDGDDITSYTTQVCSEGVTAMKPTQMIGQYISQENVLATKCSDVHIDSSTQIEQDVCHRMNILSPFKNRYQ